ncbi:unnamed protein product [Rotaria magnacalcarata]|uniref:Uncharacterized protein n=4 Tax=Rotaria magnacalcarata TaxID=392030 RepID=A0A818ZQM0_9BILA|nr:unnamed protein product [Rotaria magnacalcarata]CAF3772350.1 unnamed protein product [Rotaria magnacalcarata]
MVYFNFIRRSFFRRSLFCRLLFAIGFIICVHLLTFSNTTSSNQYYEQSVGTIVDNNAIHNYNNTDSCHFKPSTDEFILKYKPVTLVGLKPEETRFEPTIERIRNLLEIIRSKEDTYQPLLQNFDVFNMINPDITLKAYADESNIDEIKTLYNRYIKLMPDNKTIHVDRTIIDYLKQISSYLSDGLRNNRANRLPVECLHKPVFVLACDEGFFNILQGAIHSLDEYWPGYKIVFYDMGLSRGQVKLLKKKCKQCTIIKFPFSSIKSFASHIDILKTYAFKPFVVQDALRRYGTIIYGDASARFNSNSFNPVLIDNYIRGFAVRELPNHYLSCFTRTGTFGWFNQSYSQFDEIYMSEANFLVVTDTFLTRLIMKAWLTCALEPECIMALGSKSNCRGSSTTYHRYDQSAMVIILTHFFFQGTKSSWGDQHLNDPAPYDMFTSIQMNLGDIKRGYQDPNYLSEKKIP